MVCQELIEKRVPETGRAVSGDALLSLRIHFTTFPVLGVLFCLRSSMQAMGWKVAPMLSSCIELGMKILSALWLIPRLGFLGTRMTEPITWVLMTAFLLAVYFTGRTRVAGTVLEEP